MKKHIHRYPHCSICKACEEVNLLREVKTGRIICSDCLKKEQGGSK